MTGRGPPLYPTLTTLRFSATEQIESDYFLKTNQLKTLSPEQIVACDKVDAGCNGGLGFVEGTNPGRCTAVPLQKWGFDSPNFPFFVHPWTLNTQDPSKFVVWTAGWTAGGGGGRPRRRRHREMRRRRT